MTQDFIPEPQPGQAPHNMVQGSLVLTREGRSHHYRASATGCHLQQAVLEERPFHASPDSNAPVRVDQGEP